ncbi:MAG: methionyl-tRNA formyltransferase [Planctomycetota bacterium]|nr:methionyl-tRNA formyltransferase [Planctomycetota bacterium]
MKHSAFRDSCYLPAMRIVFAGTPEYAVASLRALASLAPAHELAGVVTQPDRPRGRKGEPAPPEVKVAALELGIPGERILQPESINRPEALAALRELKPDLLCVVAYGGLLKDEALALPARYALNAHGSLLPRHRGASPIQAAILHGDEQTGVCIMKMVRALDAGPVLWWRAIPLGPGETAGSLHDRLADLSGIGWIEAVRLIEAGKERFEPQDDARATYAPKLEKESGALDWTREAMYLERHVRAMSPWPGAWTTVRDAGGLAPRPLRIERAAVASAKPPAGATPGTAWFERSGERGRWFAACGSGALELLEVQQSGGKTMGVEPYLRGAGRAYAEGARLGA